MLLSELQKLIEEKLETYGDMPVIRARSLDIDGIVSNDFNKNLVRYSGNDFNVIKIKDNNDFSYNYFNINTPFYD
jgi:hypothetical protein